MGLRVSGAISVHLDSERVRAAFPWLCERGGDNGVDNGGELPPWRGGRDSLTPVRQKKKPARWRVVEGQQNSEM